jgi:hypothetical protein
MPSIGSSALKSGVRSELGLPTRLVEAVVAARAEHNQVVQTRGPLLGERHDVVALAP